MRYVYVVNIGFDYEGQQTQAVFSSLKAAREYHVHGGDSKHILRVKLDSDNLIEIPEPKCWPLRKRRNYVR